MNKALSRIKAYLELDNLFGIDCYYVAQKPAHASCPSLDALRKETMRCAQCKLSKTRTEVVFGEGNPRAALMFVGEGPGHEEDLQGRPFVGDAGKLLDKILAAMGLTREDVYIANIVKCRPPQNRVPEEDEIESCKGYLTKQISLIRPKVICALGRCAAQTLLNTQVPIGGLRGTIFEIEKIKIIPTYHPAYLLRNPSAKKLVWQDMKKVLSLLSS
jgi:DNA polymerase